MNMDVYCLFHEQALTLPVQAISLDLNAEEVTQLDLGDIITDVLVVVQAGTGNVGITRLDIGIGLKEC
jgi:hypothetical protein